MLTPVAVVFAFVIANAAPAAVDPGGRPWRVAGAPCDSPEACNASCAAGVPEGCAWFGTGAQRFRDVQRCKQGEASTCAQFRATQGSLLAPWATQRLLALCGQGDPDACRLVFTGATALPLAEHTPAALDVAAKLQPRCAEVRGDAAPRVCAAFAHACGLPSTCAALCARGFDGACVEAQAIPDDPSPAAVAAVRALCPKDLAACVVLVRWAGDLKDARENAAAADAAKAGWAGLTDTCNATRRDGCSAALDAWATWETRPPEALLKQALSTLVAACAAGDDGACVDVAANRRNVGTTAQHDVVGDRLAPRCDAGSDAACEALLFAGGLQDGGPKKPAPSARARAQRALDALTARCLGGVESACVTGERSTPTEADRATALDHALCVHGRSTRCHQEPFAERCAAGDVAACEGIAGTDVAAASAGLLAACHEGDAAACARGAALASTTAPQVAATLAARACSLGAAGSCTVAPPPPPPPPQAAPAFTQGAVVEVLWKGEWYKAVVLDVKYKSYRVHYAGYAAQYDEWVGDDRVRTLRAKP